MGHVISLLYNPTQPQRQTRIHPTAMGHVISLPSRLLIVTWGCYSVLILGLEFADSEQHDLNGPNEDACQAAIEDQVEEEDLNCDKTEQILLLRTTG